MIIQAILLIVVIFWLLGLSALGIWLFRFTSKLTKGVSKGNLIRILEEVISKEAKNSKSISEVAKEINRIDNEMKPHVQKVGLVRFNPFKELGGDHSFALSLLNKDDTGVILTGLHTRARTRVYIKEIIKGNSKHKLSLEEEEAMVTAQ